MNRDQDISNNLLEQKRKIISDIMTYFRDITHFATARVDSTASVGQAAASSMALETTLNGVIKSTEDLLTLTRALRELWAIGPLAAPEGEGDVGVTKQIEEDSSAVFEILERMRGEKRMGLLRELGEEGDGTGRIRYAVDNDGAQEGVNSGNLNLKGLPRVVKGRR
ncbi:hypothetical protein QBC43DRAFT_313003 [Cladorrhinum sp. PSN259]|nr:hypothetical protein QBC43DRAFT_313003 [Cladorrhinum sp. PSN259]